MARLDDVELHAKVRAILAVVIPPGGEVEGTVVYFGWVVAGPGVPFGRWRLAGLHRHADSAPRSVTVIVVNMRIDLARRRGDLDLAA